RGAIVEVNAGPGLLMHLKPAEGEPQPVGLAIINHLFSGEENGRIPIVGITGTHGKTVVSQLVARLLNLNGLHTGLACGDGLYFNNQQVEKKNCANWTGAHRVLLNRAVEAAVFENGGTTILSEGLAYDRCQVGVVTNIAINDTLPEYYIDDAEQMAKVLRTQVDIVLPSGVAVLNAADALVTAMAELCDGEVMFFGMDATLPVIAEQLMQNKRAVFVRDGQIMLATGKHEIMLAQVATIPLTADGQPTYQTENVLAAVAATWALGIAVDLIRAGIETFNLEQKDRQ
ncbi:Mur ligase family protein, partial [Glaciimonas sp. GG7]